jgi:hypothetical protein
MSSPRVQRIFEALPSQIKNVGGHTFDINGVTVWRGLVASTAPQAGKDAVVIDIDSATWADNNRRIILIAEPYADKNNVSAFKTQSHAAGQFIDGSVSFKLYYEASESPTGAQEKFFRQVLHCLVGQLAAPVEIFIGTNDVQPRVEGVDGASGANETACSFVSAGKYLPYGMAVAGGV